VIKKILQLSFSGLLFFFQHFTVLAQDGRTQYPSFLAKSYVEVNLGYISYPFSNKLLEPGYQASSINIPHFGVRLVLLGYRFNNHLSAQVSYMRPVLWVKYKNINGDQGEHSVFMNIGGLTLKSAIPISKKFSVYGEAGLGLVTRSGTEINNTPVITDASFGTVLLGTGLKYHVNKKWDLQLGGAYTPPNTKIHQPYTLFVSGGFTYNMTPLPADRVERNSKSGYIFPHQLIQVGYSTNALGYGVNKLVSEDLHIFWGGDAELRRGFTLHYQRNVFHSRKVFALDWGASFSTWESRIQRDKFYTLSLYPLFRFTALRLKPFDLYLNYSVAGPTYISRLFIEDINTGKHFTFQDFMGMGVFAGKKRNLNAEIRIAHYSNGNIFSENAGVKIPLTFNLGFAF
jgi:opacity protein-like surface antigen